MKKVSVLFGVVCFIFAACSNPQQTTKQDENQPKEECKKMEGGPEHCKDMTPEQKAACEAWKNWENQTPEQKATLIAERKAKIDKKMAEMEAKEAEMKAKREEFKAKWAKFDKLDIEAQKALIDEFISMHHKPCFKPEGGCSNKPCCKHQEGTPNKPCPEHKEGCKKK